MHWEWLEICYSSPSLKCPGHLQRSTKNLNTCLIFSNTHAHVCPCTHTVTHMCMHAHIIHACTHSHKHTHTCTHTHAHMHTHTHTHTHTITQSHTCTHAQSHIHSHTRTESHTHTHTSMYTMPCLGLNPEFSRACNFEDFWRLYIYKSFWIAGSVSCPKSVVLLCP